MQLHELSEVLLIPLFLCFIAGSALLLSDDLVGPLNYYRASLLFGNSLVWPKTKLRFPTLMVWGTKDGALEKKMADLSGDYVDHYSVKYVEGASHWVQQEEPDQTNAFIRKFLQE